MLDLFTIKDNEIHIKAKGNTSYFAAMIADFIRYQLLENSLSITYETVMSHVSKIDFLKLAKAQDYKK